MTDNGLMLPVFMPHQDQLKLQAGVNIAQASCTFEQQAYHDRLFDDCNITFPATLERAVNKRKAEFLAGRYCAQQALVRLGVYPSTVGIGALRNPLWPTGVIGSISHSDQAAIAVVRLDADIIGLGVDIENIIEDKVIEQTKTHILQPDEMNLLPQQGMTASQLFTIIFSIKESFFKAAFLLVNAYFDFDAVSVINIDSEAQEVLFKLNYSLHPTLPKGMYVTGKYYLINQHSVMSLVTI